MRIISGSHRGRPLRAPKGMATRPTTDRVRESLFGVLGDIDGYEVIDCYAGTGALGLEALSRGATNATFIESARDACAVIKKNADSLQLTERSLLLCMLVANARPALHGRRFDLVLSDPPWPICQEAAGDVMRLIRPLLAPGARVVLGHPKRNPLEVVPSAGLVFEQTRSWGDSAMSFWRLDPDAKPE